MPGAQPANRPPVRALPPRRWAVAMKDQDLLGRQLQDLLGHQQRHRAFRTTLLSATLRADPRPKPGGGHCTLRSGAEL
jgi:hypothetical protein